MTDRSDTPFEKWAQAEGVPIVRGYHLPNAYEIALKPWERTGGLAAFIVLEGGEGFSGAYVSEIPAGVSLKPERHLFEEKIYILQGKGKTKFWNEHGLAQTVAWQEYGLFSPPLNVWHQHSNTGNQPARYVAVTNAPLIFNIYRNPDFIFGTDFIFRDRYDNEPNYFDGKGKFIDNPRWPSWPTWAGGYILDVRQPYLTSSAEYGKGYGVLEVALSGNGMGSHLAQIEVGTYKKVHRHAGGAHLIIAEGTGYALMWQDWDRRVRVGFQKGTVYSPPEGWWHTHFNTGSQVVKQVALRCGIPGIGKTYRSSLGIKKGGDMLDHEDEDPAIRSLFEQELRKKTGTSWKT